MDNPILAALGMLTIVLLVLAGAYFFTRWAGMSLGGGFAALRSGGRIRVLDRAGLGKDQALLVIQLANRHFRLGSSPSGFSLLAELPEEEGAMWACPPASGGTQEKAPLDFQEWIRKFREKK